MTQPRLTLKVAVYIIFKKDEKILFLRRFQTGWADGLYTLPAGHIEEGETPIQTAIREVWEEIGIEINETQLSFENVIYDKSYSVDFFFLANNWIGKPKLMEPEKSDELKWLNPLKDSSKIIPKVLLALTNINNKQFYTQFTPENNE